MKLINTGWTDEARAASLAVRRAKAAERKRQQAREEMFARQREQSGRDFVENWYPRGRDGYSEDPHYGVSTPEAPYGYVEGTNEPRKEPLYDQYGRPIIPRPWEDYHPKKRGGHWEWVKADPKIRDPYADLHRWRGEREEERGVAGEGQGSGRTVGAVREEETVLRQESGRDRRGLEEARRRAAPEVD